VADEIALTGNPRFTGWFGAQVGGSAGPWCCKMTNLFYRRILETSEVGDLQSFKTHLARLCEEMGFELFSAIVMEGRPGWPWRSFMVGNAPAAWEASSMDVEDGRRDPFLKRLKRLSVPVIYDESLYLGEQCGDLWEAQIVHGYKTGIGAAVHLNGKHSMISFDRTLRLPSNENKLSRVLADLQLLTVHSHEAALRLLLPQPIGKVSLTDRQLDVLRWIAQGKTAWATAQILGLAERTVNGHLSAIYTKLDAGSQTQAVFNAVKLGLL
jgi:LuxR family quorum-sensing system transcriptional regulator SolR